MENDIILKIEDLTKTYPGVKALDRVSLSVARGEIHAIVGENGAGKSTLIKAIAGAITPDSGAITINGRKYTSITPKESRANNIEVIYQEFNLVPTLSVGENIFLGGRASDKKYVDYAAIRRKSREILSKLGIDMDPDTPVRELTPAQQELVEIAKAVSKDVKLLIMDEPTAPLTVHEVELMFNIVRGLKQSGVTLIYISHRLEEIFGICDRVSVLRDGRYIDTRLVKDTSRTELIQLMVGRQLNTDYPAHEKPGEEVVLEVSELSGNGIGPISFELHKGEILGIAGLVGSGRTEIMRVLYGAEPKDAGTVRLFGKETDIASPSDAIRCGFGLIPEDRKAQGLFLPMSIKWNILFNSLKRISRFTFVNESEEKRIAQEYSEKMGIKTPSLDQKVLNLSGGNQQKVVIAKTLAADAEIIIFDEPTRGIDVGAKHEIYNLMCECVAAGKSIIMISSEMDELLGMSDNVVVLCEGRQQGTIARDRFTQDLVLDLASGSK